MTQSPSVYADLTIRGNISYFARALGLRGTALREAVERTLDEVDLVSHADVLVGDLSGGQESRVSLAGALVGRPTLLVLDEPTVGLDPVLRRDLWNLFRRLAAQGHSLMVSSHVMDEATRCDRLVLLREGRVLADLTPAELLAQTGRSTPMRHSSPSSTPPVGRRSGERRAHPRHRGPRPGRSAPTIAPSP